MLRKHWRVFYGLDSISERELNGRQLTADLKIGLKLEPFWSKNSLNLMKTHVFMGSSFHTSVRKIS